MLRSTFSTWREYLTPVSHKSTFLSSGELTPDEFVQAGDYLCHMFPTWKWNEPEKDISYRNFLPDDKQFLIIRKVPCNERAQQFISTGNEKADFYSEGLYLNNEGSKYDNKEDYECWMISKTDNDVVNNDSSLGNETWRNTADIDYMMESMGIEDDDEGADIINNPINIGRRYYDLYITYSTSYKVPKMYIVGFNNSGSPLTPEQMFEDITPDYRAKTATIEKLPFYKTMAPSVSIHPCKHANVMRVLLDKVRIVKQRRRREELKKENDDYKDTSENDEWEDLQDDMDDTLRVDMYLVVFLKFIISVTPGIEHDYTMEGW